MALIPLIVVIGATASGKTSVAIEIAKKYNGEIISADSMQIYKGMDIATAKPSLEERQGIKHHIIDFLEADEKFSVSDFCELAHQKIKDINSKNKTAIICGGTGLYVKSLIENIKFSQEDDSTEYKTQLENLAEEKGADFLYEMLREKDEKAALNIHKNNLVRVIRALELIEKSNTTFSDNLIESKKTPKIYDTIIINLEYKDRKINYDRIDKRVDIMVESGLLEEAKEYIDNDTLKTSAQAIGYKELTPYFNGELPLNTAIDNLKQSTRRYAKRQLTWNRRLEGVNTFHPDEYTDYDDMLKVIFSRIDNFIKGRDGIDYEEE